MIPYWIMFILPAIVALNSRPVTAQNPDGSVRSRVSNVWVFVGLVLTMVIGFRYEVGGDWNNYLHHLKVADTISWALVFVQPEPGHWFVNKVMLEAGWGLTGVNLFYGLIFSTGLIAFVKTLPRPWLALTVAVPYLIIVVAMGYSRQATALGFAMFGLAAIRRNSFLNFSIWVLIGATFHNTVILLLPIAAMSLFRSRLQQMAAVAFIIFLSFELFFSYRFVSLVDVYVSRQLTESQGALVRLFMNGLPASLFLLYRKKISLSDSEKLMWSVISLASIAMLAAYFSTGLSTALDRIALYFLPLQLVVFSHLPDLIGLRGKRNIEVVICVVVCYAGAMFVWLNFAAHAGAWIPFRVGIEN